jgi:hypothetical protein
MRKFQQTAAFRLAGPAPIGVTRRPLSGFGDERRAASQLVLGDSTATSSAGQAHLFAAGQRISERIRNSLHGGTE